VAGDRASTPRSHGGRDDPAKLGRRRPVAVKHRRNRQERQVQRDKRRHWLRNLVQGGGELLGEQPLAVE
jgi:hypothetical protein